MGVECVRKRKLVYALIPTLCASMFLPVRTLAQADGFSVLILSPQQGHSGDTIYLSGSGLEPRQHLYVMMACPNWYDKSLSTYNNGVIQWNGPTTDAHGQFRAFPFQVLTLHHFRSAGCTMYIRDGANPYGPRFPPTFLILPPDQPAPPCWRQICVHVKSSPVRVRSGLVESVVVRSYPGAWPGARVDLSVSAAGVKPTLRHLSLDLNGYAHVEFPITAQGTQPTVASVKVRMHLGAWGGSGDSRFVIVH